MCKEGDVVDQQIGILIHKDFCSDSTEVAIFFKQ